MENWNCIIVGLGIVPPLPQDRTHAHGECHCPFTPFFWGSDDPPTMIAMDLTEDSWHHLRECQACGKWWWGLHCPHDGYQNPCPDCKTVPTPVPE